MTLTVAYKEVGVRRGESPQLSADPDGAQGVRLLKFAWGDRIQARDEIMGYSTRIAPGVLSRELPECHPDDPHMWARRCTFHDALGARGYDTIQVPWLSGTYPVKSAKYEFIVYRIEYSWVPWEVLSDTEITTEYERYTEVDVKGATDYVTPPSLQFGALKWVGGGANVNMKPAFATYGKLIPYANLTFTVHNLPYAYFPRDIIMASYGKVSKEDLNDPNDSNKLYKAGSLLFCGHGQRIYRMTFEGRKAIDLQLYFRHDPALLEDGTVGGPNSFPCFREFPFKRRLISDTGTDPGIGNRSTRCVYDEMNPNLLWKVL